MVAFEFRVHLRAGPHHPRGHGRDLDVVVRELGPKRIGEPDERKLAHAVGCHVRHRHFPADRGNVDDPPAAGPAHVREDLLDEIKGRPEMELHRFLEIRPAHIFERADFDNAGVVDQGVDRSEMIDHGLDRA